MKLIRKVFYRAVSHYKDELPADMLRYDVAFASEVHPGVICFPTFRTKEGNFGGQVTAARWRSFGLTLEPLKGDEPGLIPEHWYTYRHPRAKLGGPVDYGKLEKVTLARYLQVKEPMEL